MPAGPGTSHLETVPPPQSLQKAFYQQVLSLLDASVTPPTDTTGQALAHASPHFLCLLPNPVLPHVALSGGHAPSSWELGVASCLLLCNRLLTC